MDYFSECSSLVESGKFIIDWQQEGFEEVDGNVHVLQHWAVNLKGVLVVLTESGFSGSGGG